MKVYQLCPGKLGHPFNGMLYLFVPVARARLKTGVAVGYGSHSRHQDTHLRIDYTERVDQRQIVSDEIITIIGPVARIGIIDTQMNHNNISREGQCPLKFLLSDIGTMPFIQQCGP